MNEDSLREFLRILSKYQHVRRKARSIKITTGELTQGIETLRLWFMRDEQLGRSAKKTALQRIIEKKES